MEQTSLGGNASALFLLVQLGVVQQGLRHLPAAVPQRRQLLEGHLSDEDHQEAQDHDHAEEGAHHGGRGLLLVSGGHAGTRGLGGLLSQQVLDVGQGAVVGQWWHSQDVAEQRVEIDGSHGGFGVVLAEGRPTGQEEGMHAAEGVVVAVVAHCGQTAGNSSGHKQDESNKVHVMWIHEFIIKQRSF